MLNKKFHIMAVLAALLVVTGAHAQDEEFVSDENVLAAEMDMISADAIDAYQVEGSLFQQITDLEQEKVLMQLEKERAQLDLELDRLAAEKIKLHMEIDTLSGRAEAQQQEFETERAKLEAEAAKLAREKAALESAAENPPAQRTTRSANIPDDEGEDTVVLADHYRLVSVFGAGNQLQATVQDLATGQTKRVSVGKMLDGFLVQSISLDDGVVFVRDGVAQNLNVGGDNY